MNQIQITDFAVRIKNLPPPGVYITLENLRVLLTLHLEQVISDPALFPESIIDKLEGSGV